MTNLIEIDPVFKELLVKAWGSQFGNIRIVGNGGKPTLNWNRATELETVSQQADTSVFWSTTGFDTAAMSRKKLKHSDMSHCGLLWVDFDEGIPGMEQSDKRIHLPNFIIRTSPDKAHWFYIIEQTDLGFLFLETCQHALSEHLGGDSGARDLGHISRLPGSINPKNDHVVTIEKLHDKVHRLSDLNPLAIADGRHEFAKKALARTAATGGNVEIKMKQLEQWDFTYGFEDDERDGLISWAGTSEAAAAAPAPLADSEVQVEAWDRKGNPNIPDYQRELDQFDIAFNAIGGRLMINKDTMSDGMFSVLFSHFQGKGYRQENYLVHGMKANAQEADRFNPITDWIEREEWDGDDHIAYLAEFFKDDGTGDFEIFLRHWLVGAVAKVSKPDGAFNRMLVLEGKQGIGKSEFAKWLVPLGLREYYCQDIPRFDNNNKDTLIKSTTKWVWEIQELGQSTLNYQDQLKSFLSQTRVGERIPYDKFPMDETTRASYIGTVNDLGGFLTDPTGNRRYMAVSIWDIDWRGYTARVNLRQVWAQALALYKDGFKWELSGDAERRADNANESFVAASPLAEQLDSLVDITEDKNAGMTTAQVMNLLVPLGGKPFSPQEVAGALRSIGANQVRREIDGKHVRIWAGTQPRGASA